MLELIRYNFSERSTQGIIGFDGNYIADSLELPWKNNQPFVSCIPEGIYEIEHRTCEDCAVRSGFLLREVKDRTGVLIHPANQVEELEGCIAPGTRYGDVLYYSRAAFDKILKAVGEVGTLKISGILK